MLLLHQSDHFMFSFMTRNCLQKLLMSQKQPKWQGWKTPWVHRIMKWGVRVSVSVSHSLPFLCFPFSPLSSSRSLSFSFSALSLFFPFSHSCSFLSPINSFVYMASFLLVSNLLWLILSHCLSRWRTAQSIFFHSVKMGQ